MSAALSIFGAARDADGALALREGDAGHTFAELAALTERRIAELQREVRRGEAFALEGRNTLQTIVTLYALLELRVPALLLHPRLTASEQAAERAAAAAAAGSLPDDAAAVLFTSGTTGPARGAVLTRAALLASAQAGAANLGWQDDDCWLLAMPIGRIGGLSIVTRCLAARRTVALAPAFDAAALPDLLLRHRVTLLSLVPTMLALVLDAHPDWQPPPWLRALLLGGAAAPPSLLARARARHLPIVITYGCTESCSQVVATPYAQRFDPAHCGAGQPLPTAELRIIDGHIQVRGPMLMAGYLGEPPRAAHAWFDTGDLGELDARGCLHVHARRVDLIVSGGENVYPAEVERIVLGCPGVRAAAVFGVADDTWGQTVAVALVPEARPPRDEELLAHLRAHLAPHKRPRRLCLVDALPQTSAGKLDRHALQTLVPLLRPLQG